MPICAMPSLCRHGFCVLKANKEIADMIMENGKKIFTGNNMEAVFQTVIAVDDGGQDEDPQPMVPDDAGQQRQQVPVLPSDTRSLKARTAKAAYDALPEWVRNPDGNSGVVLKSSFMRNSMPKKVDGKFPAISPQEPHVDFRVSSCNCMVFMVWC